MNKLVIAEKPSVALRLALSLGNQKPDRKIINGVSYYELQSGSDKLFIVAAVGHLFTIREKGSSRKLPVFDIEWAPSYMVSKGSYFTKKYLDTILAIGKNCSAFINACDYDIEGSVIGTNIIKFVSNGNVNSEVKDGNAFRMKFSTTTTEDLVNAYNNISGLDIRNFDAGEARHTLDWIWGINFSRALMYSLASKSQRKIISIGRVQGPTLAILVKREKEIKEFVPKPYWEVYALVKGVEFINLLGKIESREGVEAILSKSKGSEGVVESVVVKENRVRPYPPFDLTSLQVEASHAFGMDPSRTLSIAQSLYEHAYISYPRTSSQKLPPTLNLPNIIGMLSKNKKYSEIAEYLMKNSMYKPAEGYKEDEAHPAIFPTGVMPKALSNEEEKVYDLITRRFLACFGNSAVVELTNVTVRISDWKYGAEGKRVLDKGWISIYEPYIKVEQKQLPKFEQGERVKVEKLHSKELKTKPPNRYSKASLIATLERKELGTKATRAEIIDTLFKRGYIKNPGRIEVTAFGMGIYDALSEYFADILDENLTRKLEEDMENISRGKTTKQQVIEEGKEIVAKLILKFKENEGKIGTALAESLKSSEASNVLGKCPKCGGDLVIRHSKAGKSFVGCSNWPKCTVTYSLPQNALIVPTKKVCEFCHTPIIKVFRKGKKPFEMDLDPNCVSKKDWKVSTAAEAAKAKAEEKPKVEEKEKVEEKGKTKRKGKPKG